MGVSIKMFQGALPLFAEKGDWTTYSEIALMCDEEYALLSPALIGKIKRSLVLYEAAKSLVAAQDSLQDLNSISLELSCLNTAWNTFSNAVFEAVVIPAKTSTLGSAKHLREVLNSTLKALSK